MKHCVAFLLAVALVAGVCQTPADAFPQFAKQFGIKYVGDKSNETQQKLAAAVMAAKCNVCHDPKPGADGKVSKKNRNPYGEALHKFIGKQDKSNVEKIQMALTKVESMKEEGADQTFGELLKSGQLPWTAPAQ